MWMINPRKKKRHHKKRSKSHVMKAHGISRKRSRKRNAKRRFIVVKKFYAKNARRKHHRRGRRRNPAVSVPTTGKLFNYFKSGLAIAAGYVAPRFVEPMLPSFGASQPAMLARKAVGLILPGIGVQFLAKYVGLSRKTVNLFWAGIGVNAVVQVLAMAGYNVPGLSAGDEAVAALPPPAIDFPALGVGGAFSDQPERNRNNFMM
jgi:hypothetical protein